MEKIDRDDILLKIYQEQKEMKKQIGKMQEKIEGIPQMQEQIKLIPQMQEQIKLIPQMQEQIKLIPQMQEDIKELKEEVRKISGTVARIEVEHGEKLQILFDAFTSHSEILKNYEKRINSCERKIEQHDDQIYYLKSEVQGCK